MGSFGKTTLITFVLAFFSIQFYLTFFGGFLWPFSSHRLFSQSATMHKEIVQAVVTDTNGHVTYHHPGQVIPIEYARCSGLVRKLAKQGSKEQKRLFCAYLKKRLKEQPWRAFDEMYSSAHTQFGVADVRFETHSIQFIEDAYPNTIVKLKAENLLP